MNVYARERDIVKALNGCLLGTAVGDADTTGAILGGILGCRVHGFRRLFPPY